MQGIELYLELIGIIVMGVVGVFFIATAIALFHSNRKKPSKPILIFAIDFIFAAAGIIGLTIEKIAFAYLYPLPIGDILGRMSAMIAIIMSVGAVIMINYFTLLMTFERHVKWALPIISVIAIIPAVILDWAIASYVATIFEGELTYPIYVTIIMASMLIPAMIVPSITFFYYAFLIREHSLPHAKRGIIMGISVTVLTLTYIVELAGTSLILALIFRTGFFISAFLMYISLTLPEWYKNWIKWPED